MKEKMISLSGVQVSMQTMEDVLWFFTMCAAAANGASPKIAGECADKAVAATRQRIAALEALDEKEEPK